MSDAGTSLAQRLVERSGVTEELDVPLFRVEGSNVKYVTVDLVATSRLCYQLVVGAWINLSSNDCDGVSVAVLNQVDDGLLFAFAIPCGNNGTPLFGVRLLE